MIATVAGARPGRWRIGYRTVSSVDGHETFGRYSFTVAGRPACGGHHHGHHGNGDEKPANVENPGADDGPGDDSDGQAITTSDGEGSSSPGAIVALVAGGAVVAALVVRRLLRR
jgi:hypothetical protein